MTGPRVSRPYAQATIASIATLALSLGIASGVGRAQDMVDLRQQSLDLVNAARGQRGLGALELRDNLNEAAQAHARDMLQRNFYAHVTPEGETVRDRFIATGGSQRLLVAENIAKCEGCPPPADEAAVENLHEGWMQSPGHRENILTKGLTGYGFGLAEGDGRRFAVQTFSGPGSPQSLAAGETATPLAPLAQTELAASIINERRADNEQVVGEETLADAARAMVPAGSLSSVALDELNPLEVVIPDEATWRSYRTIVGSCGGCGVEATDADVEFFIGQWLERADYSDILTDPSLSSIGLHVEADGSGRKIAILLLAG